jgi:hypothetical protein
MIEFVGIPQGPTRPPRLNEVVRRVARLGGFLARQGDGEPGAKTLWQRLQRVVSNSRSNSRKSMKLYDYKIIAILYS